METYTSVYSNFKNSLLTINKFLKKSLLKSQNKSPNSKFYLWLANTRLFKKDTDAEFSTLIPAIRTKCDEAALVYNDYNKSRISLIYKFKEDRINDEYSEIKFESQKNYSRVTSNSLFKFVKYLSKNEQNNILESVKYVDEQYYPNDIRSKIWTHVNDFHESFRSEIVSDAIANIYSSDTDTQEKAIECIAKAKVNDSLTKEHGQSVVKLDQTLQARLAAKVSQFSDSTYIAAASEEAEQLKIARLSRIDESNKFGRKTRMPMARHRDDDRGL